MTRRKATDHMSIMNIFSKPIAVRLALMILFLVAAILALEYSTSFQGIYKRDNLPVRSQMEKPISCDYSHREYEMCHINGPTLLDPTTKTFYKIGSHNPSQPDATLKTKPYPYKSNPKALSNVNQITLTTAPTNQSCGLTHNSPALVFSTGGFMGNFFHEFADGLVPLFITVNSLFPDHDVNFVITDFKGWWVEKYSDLLLSMTKHLIINMDDTKTSITHCFPSVIIGLVSHGPLVVDPTLLLKPITLLDFHSFIENAYEERSTTTTQKTITPAPKNYLNVSESCSIITRPKVALVNRKGNVSRVFTNLKAIIDAIEEVGFEAILFEPNKTTKLRDSFRVIQSSQALVGIHGAGLTHFVFLKKGMVFGEIVPLGVDMVSKMYFEEPSKEIGLEYMKYKIGAKESSFYKIYGGNDLRVRDPIGYIGKNNTKIKFYLKDQNINIDISRFKGYLKKIVKKANRFC